MTPEKETNTHILVVCIHNIKNIKTMLDFDLYRYTLPFLCVGQPCMMYTHEKFFFQLCAFFIVTIYERQASQAGIDK